MFRVLDPYNYSVAAKLSSILTPKTHLCVLQLFLRVPAVRSDQNILLLKFTRFFFK